MERFIDRLRSRGQQLRPLSGESLLRAFFSLFYTFHMTDMLLGSQPNPEEQPEMVQELVEIYLHGILAG